MKTKDLDLSIYLGWDACSHSRLEQLRKSPAHCRYSIDFPEEPSPAMRLGSAIDCAVLEPEAFEKNYKVGYQCQAETRNGSLCSRNGTLFDPDSKEFEPTFYCAQHGAEIKNLKPTVSESDWEICIETQKNVHLHPTAKALIDDADAIQQSILWKDGTLLSKARADVVCWKHRTLADLKSTTDASPVNFERAIYNFGYHRQAAFYLRGYEKLGKVFEHFCIIAVEKSPPYAVAVYRLRDEALDLGRREILPLMDLYQKCLESDHWPGYPVEPIEIGLPRWADYEIKKRDERL